MKVIERRLVTLEQAAPAEGRCFVWAAVGETADEAIAREYPDGVAEPRKVIVFRFSEPPDDGG